MGDDVLETVLMFAVDLSEQDAAAPLVVLCMLLLLRLMPFSWSSDGVSDLLLFFVDGGVTVGFKIRL